MDRPSPKYRSTKQHPNMNNIVPIAVRTAIVFAAFLVIQYKIPYYLLVIGGLGTAAFMWKTSDDRQTTIGVLIGTIFFGIFAFLFGKV